MRLTLIINLLMFVSITIRWPMGKVCKTIVKPAMMYAAETWAVKKSQYVAEMRVLGRMSGVTKVDRIRNERIRGIAKVVEIAKKVQESSLKWYGHVLLLY